MNRQFEYTSAMQDLHFTPQQKVEIAARAAEAAQAAPRRKRRPIGRTALIAACLTVVLAVACTAIGCVIGCGVGLIRSIPTQPGQPPLQRGLLQMARAVLAVYVEFFRGTPLMLQLMVVYYGPFLLFDFTPPGNWRFGAVIVGFVINYAAYFAEIYRAGYESIPVGQFEAAQVLGYTGGQTFGRILLPQMIRRVLPPVTNEVITLVKDTSLASVIGTVEMFTRAKQIVASPNTPGMLALAAAGLFYYVFNYIVAFAMERAERSLAYYQ